MTNPYEPPKAEDNESNTASAFKSAAWKFIEPLLVILASVIATGLIGGALNLFGAFVVSFFETPLQTTIGGMFLLVVGIGLLAGSIVLIVQWARISDTRPPIDNETSQ